MSAAERAAILTKTWTFWFALAVAILEGLEAALSVLQPEIPAVYFTAAKAALAPIVMVAKFLSITPPPSYEEAVQRYREALARDHEGNDGE